MSDPIVLITRNSVKEGKLEEFERFYVEGAKTLKREKPGTVAFLAYASEDGAEVTIVHVFPDADAMGTRSASSTTSSSRAYPPSRANAWI
jgi:quinol monooxygenase YgiN